jgi:formamidopyrimidine-DNA glycosylase
MPELPDLTLYQERLIAQCGGLPLTQLAISKPFVLRTVSPSPADFAGRALRAVERIGKRLIFVFDEEHFAVIHLMIAGRFKWIASNKKPPAITLASFVFDTGAVAFTEAGSKRRASLHLVQGRAGLAAFDRGGIEPLTATSAEFIARLRRGNHTLKRVLTDPGVFAGIGNSYSDEILHRARLSPLMLTSRLDDEAAARLHAATVATVVEWTDRLRRETGEKFPEKVTAFREGMAVHGRFRLPCPVCGDPVQRIRYATNETNYCVTCQTGGRLLADRAMSRLLKQDWPRSLDELDQ